MNDSIRAIDADIGINAKIVYSFSENPTVFEMEPLDGSIRIAAGAVLDREETDMYDLEVPCKSFSEPTTDCTFR